MTTNTFNENEYISQIKNNIDIVKENIDKLNLPYAPKIMAVTKTVAPRFVNIAIEKGITLLGENRAQELCEKYEDYSLKHDNIHFIGHLQNNKVKYIIDKVSTVASLDSLKLAKTLDDFCKRNSKNMDVLVEINISQSPDKTGIDKSQISDFLSDLVNFENLKVKGLMCIPSKDNYAHEFTQMKNLYDDLQKSNSNNITLDTLSMGMSADYIEAIKCGSNLIRLGTAIFNKRNY